MLVYPTVMLYPRNLIYVNLFDALHRGNGEMMQNKRLKVFWLIVLGVFVYEWFPEYIAPLLGGFNIVCLAARNTEWVSYVFGGAYGNEGMGLLGFGVDWANITSAPFYLPLATQISQYIGFATNYWLLPLIYYTSVLLLLFQNINTHDTQQHMALQELPVHLSEPILFVLVFSGRDAQPLNYHFRRKRHDLRPNPHPQPYRFLAQQDRVRDLWSAVAIRLPGHLLLRPVASHRRDARAHRPLAR
jgi:hypothetical protein